MVLEVGFEMLPDDQAPPVMKIHLNPTPLAGKWENSSSSFSSLFSYGKDGNKPADIAGTEKNSRKRSEGRL
jgi:hypothetical protein